MRKFRILVVIGGVLVFFSVGAFKLLGDRILPGKIPDWETVGGILAVCLFWVIYSYPYKKKRRSLERFKHELDKIHSP